MSDWKKGYIEIPFTEENNNMSDFNARLTTAVSEYNRAVKAQKAGANLSPGMGIAGIELNNRCERLASALGISFCEAMRLAPTVFGEEAVTCFAEDKEISGDQAKANMEKRAQAITDFLTKHNFIVDEDGGIDWHAMDILTAAARIADKEGKDLATALEEAFAAQTKTKKSA